MSAFSMRNPVWWRRVPVPVKTGNRSVVFDMGVRFAQDCDDHDPQKQRGGTAWAANAAGRNP